MCADISSLILHAPDELDWEHIQLGGEGAPPIPDGKYHFQSPSVVAFDAVDGRLRCILDPIVVVGPTCQGEKIRWTRVGTKRYKTRNSNPAIDYFAACGMTAQPQTWDDYRQLFEATVGRVWIGVSQQRAYCNHKETPSFGQPPLQLDGEGQMPKQADGKSRPTFACPICNKTVFVNSQVRRFVVQPDKG